MLSWNALQLTSFICHPELRAPSTSSGESSSSAKFLRHAEKEMSELTKHKNITKCHFISYRVRDEMFLYKTKFLAGKLVEKSKACFCMKYSQSLVVVLLQWRNGYIQRSEQKPPSWERIKIQICHHYLQIENRRHLQLNVECATLQNRTAVTRV
jgi:hypothetical protein